MTSGTVTGASATGMGSRPPSAVGAAGAPGGKAAAATAAMPRRSLATATRSRHRALAQQHTHAALNE